MGWLTSRLSPVKADTQRWIDLAEAIEEFWEDGIDAAIDFMKSLISVFSVDSAGRELLLQNMGDYFYEDNLPSDNIPMSVMWRQHELFMKQSTTPLENALIRVGSHAVWAPLWATEGDSYENQFFLTGPELHNTNYLDGSWKVATPYERKLWPMRYLTSRGVIMADLATIAADDHSYDDLIIVRSRARMLRPAHIVIEGFRYSGTSTETIISVDQPKLDGTWIVDESSGIIIMAYPSSHDDIVSKLENGEIVSLYGHSIDTLSAVASTRPVYVDHGDWIEVICGLNNSEYIGYSIGAAGLLIDGVVHASIGFRPKIKTPEDSYAIKFVLNFE